MEGDSQFDIRGWLIVPFVDGIEEHGLPGIVVGRRVTTSFELFVVGQEVSELPEMAVGVGG